MPDLMAETTQPPKGKPPTDSSPVVPVQEAHEAIRKAFPNEGELKVRHLWSANGCSRFRANWFRGQDGGMTIAKSLWLCLTRTGGGLVVTDDTVVNVRG